MRLRESRCCLVPSKCLASHFVSSSSLYSCLVSAASVLGLEFHKSTGAVKTLSLAQVRQPIYKSSQKAWQRYGDGVMPLLKALEKRGIDVTEWD